MKKAIIAAGASAVLAAMPVAASFAVTSPVTNVKDIVTFDLAAGCTMTRASGTEDPAVHPTLVYNTVAMGITAPGTFAEANGLQVDIVCTGESTAATSQTWALQAVGTGDTGHESDLKSDATTPDYIATSKTADNLNGNGSGWAFKIANNTNTDNASNFAIANTTETTPTSYSAYQLVPSAATTIATLTYDDTAASNVGVYAFQPTYIVSVADNQPAGTYTGGVNYTIVANPAG